MDVLVQKLANLLDITIEKAIELYPMFKNQFIAYKILDEVGFIGVIFFVIFIVISIISVCIYIANKQYIGRGEDSIFYEEGQSAEIAKRWLPKSVTITIISLAIMFICTILKYILTPDFMIIRELFLK